MNKKTFKTFIFIITFILIIFLVFFLRKDYEPLENNEILNYLGETNGKTKIEELPDDYNYIQALNDKCIISVHGMKLFNKSELDTFFEKVNKNEPYSIRCISYTVEGDMIITDIEYDGKNLFKTCSDFTRDEFSSKEDRTFKYGKFSEIKKEETYDEIYYYLDGKIEGELNQISIAYYSKDAKIINDYECKYLLNIKTSNKKEVVKITKAELENLYDYDIYYYGLESVSIKIDNKEINLIEALKKKIITMEDIIEAAENDSKNEIINSDMYKDGGTKIYFYGTYTIIKSHSLDGNRDVYIGIPDMNLNSVR